MARATTPLERVTDDPLPARAALVTAANQLATDESSPVDWLPGALGAGHRWRVPAISRWPSTIRDVVDR